MTKPKPPKPPALACSFCDLPRERVPLLFVGPKANICSGCAIRTVKAIIAESRADRGFMDARDTVTDGAGI